ncbi:MAG: hypothetical protein JNL42_13770 [Anaerolineae bacterium]|nr:hypothetical protein [Anaerolineae bacterium]
MSILEREIIEKFSQLDSAAQRRVRALIEREIERESADGGPEDVDALGWPIGFFSATYGSMADDPMDEVDNSHLPPPVRDDFE